MRKDGSIVKFEFPVECLNLATGLRKGSSDIDKDQPLHMWAPAFLYHAVLNPATATVIFSHTFRLIDGGAKSDCVICNYETGSHESFFGTNFEPGFQLARESRISRDGKFLLGNTLSRVYVIDIAARSLVASMPIKKRPNMSVSADG